MSFSTDVEVSTGGGVTDVVVVLEGDTVTAMSVVDTDGVVVLEEDTVNVTSAVDVESAGVVDLSANIAGNCLAQIFEWMLECFV